MHVKIEYQNKEYKLGFDRKTAKVVSETLANEDLDTYDRAEEMIACALIKHHSELTEEERKAIAVEVCKEYRIVDVDINQSDESEIDGEESAEERLSENPGLMSLLNEMIMDTIPKGFIGKATKEFVVVRD